MGNASSELPPPNPDPYINFVQSLIHFNTNPIQDETGYAVTQVGGTLITSGGIFTGTGKMTNVVRTDKTVLRSDNIGLNTLALGTQDFTIELWIDLTAYTGTPGSNGFTYLFTSGANAELTGIYPIWYMYVGGQMAVGKHFDSNTGGGEEYFRGTQVCPLNVMTHLHCSRASGKFILGVNGINDIDTTKSINFLAGNPAVSGFNGGNGSNSAGTYTEFRETIGACRYPGATYTVPAGKFANP